MAFLTETGKRSIKFTQTVDVPSLAAATTTEVTVSQLNLPAGAAVQVVPPATLNAGIGIVGAWVDASGDIIMRLMNATAGAIDPASGDWTFYVLNL